MRISLAKGFGSMLRFGSLVSSLAAVSLLAGAGCSDPDAGYKPVPPDGLTAQQRTDKQIKDVENNPNMPPDTKAMVIGQIRGHANMGQSYKK